MARSGATQSAAAGIAAQESRARGEQTHRAIRRTRNRAPRGLDFLVRVEGARVESPVSESRLNRTTGPDHGGNRTTRARMHNIARPRKHVKTGLRAPAARSVPCRHHHPMYSEKNRLKVGYQPDSVRGEYAGHATNLKLERVDNHPMNSETLSGRIVNQPSPITP